MEQFLERWLQWRNDYYSSYYYAAVKSSPPTPPENKTTQSPSPSTTGTTTTVFTFWRGRPSSSSSSSSWPLLLRVGCMISWTILEWIAAWILIFAFSTWYLWEYTQLGWRSIIKNTNITTTTTTTKYHHEDEDDEDEDEDDDASRKKRSSSIITDLRTMIPATCIPQTRTMQQKMLREGSHDDANHNNNNNNNTIIWDELIHGLMTAIGSDDDNDQGEKDHTTYSPTTPSLFLDEKLNDKEWVQFFRTNLNARQLASMWISQQVPTTTTTTTTSSTTTTTTTTTTLEVLRSQQQKQKQQQQERIRTLLRRIWPQILEFPINNDNNDSPCAISLIIPIYKEDIRQIQILLQHTHKMCDRPDRIQVVLVDAGGETFPPTLSLDDNKSNRLRHSILQTQFAELEIVAYDGTQGRGGCLNFGAKHARGAILTFLHADTFLPSHWDTSIGTALRPPSLRSSGPESSPRSIITTMCAFSMGIDMSPFQKTNSSNNKDGSSTTTTATPPYPMGLWGADRVLGYIRCSLCQLPYGDSVLSFPAPVFEYLGGYPEQPLMEDFEIVQLLRRRARMLSFSDGRRPREQITILKDRIACSPRRWQRHGVPYVILSNAYCIYRYKQCHAPAEELFEFYYRQSTAATAGTTTTLNGGKKDD